MSKYIGSKKHIKNAKNASIFGIKKIQELKEKRIQEYNLHPNLCKCCDSILSYEKRNNTFCNSSCAASYNNKIRGPKSEEVKDKISKTLKEINYTSILKEINYINKICPICNEKFSVRNVKKETKRKYCSKECRLKGMRENVSKSIKQRVKNGTHIGWQSRNILSYPEEFFIEVLKNNGLYEKCKTNFVIKKRDLGLDDDSNYFLDFFLYEKNIDLEIDGKQHKIIERSKSDKIRDSLLANNGIIVYRIIWKNINTEDGREYIKNEIDKFLEFYESINPN